MAMERERAAAVQWRALNETLAQSKGRFHKVDECGCHACTLCRAVESCLAELDRVTGAGFDGTSTNIPLGT